MNRTSSRAKKHWLLPIGLLALVVVGVLVYLVVARMHTAVTASFITHPPGATVWIDGRLVEGQKTPITGHVVVFGSTQTVVVHIQKEGYRPWTRHLSPQELGALGTIELEPEVGATPVPPPVVDVLTDPPGATVFIDGVEVGASPLTSHPIPSNKDAIRIEARLEGHAPASTVVRRARLTTDAVVTLKLSPLPQKPPPSPQPPPARRTTSRRPIQPRPTARPAPAPRPPETIPVRVSGNPAGAHVKLNGSSVGTAPLEVRVRRNDRVVVEVWKAGYEPFRQRVTPDQTRTRIIVSYDLAPVPSPTPEPVVVRETATPPTVGGFPESLLPLEPESSSSSTVSATEAPRPGGGKSPSRAEKGSTEQGEVVEQTLTVLSDPAGANVLVGGEPVGKTPLENFVVRTRQPITVALRHPGFREATRTIDPKELKKPITWSATLEMLPMDPHVCSDEDGDRWLERLKSTEDPVTDYETLKDLRVCFQQQRNWEGVLAVTDRALAHDVYGGLGVDYYARATALKEIGGTGNYKLCAQAARMAATKKLGLTQVDVWDVWYLELYCLYGYLSRSRSDISGQWDDPKELEYQLKVRYLALKNDIANKKDTLSKKEQSEVEAIEANLATLRKEMGW